MSFSRLNVFLAVLLTAVVVLLALMRVDNSRPNFQVNIADDMTYSPAYKAFAPNSNFDNGRTLQGPVAGAIAQGALPVRFEATPEDALRAGEELTNPFDLNAESGALAVERGQMVFQTFCTPCHGGDGAGNGPVAQRGFPPPPSLLTGKSREMKDGQLFHILTFGQNSMPQFAAQLTPDSRWAVITYIRSLQQKAAPAVAPAGETNEESTPSASKAEQDESGEQP
jgi:mono/diheme cytochrome c family protein